MDFVKKVNKTLVVAISAITAVTIMTTAVSASCVVHRVLDPVETLIYSEFIGSHSHIIGFNVSGSPVTVTCSMVRKQYRANCYCAICGELVNSSTYEIIEHSADKK